MPEYGFLWLKVENPVRRAFIYIMYTKAFASITLLAILANCIMLALGSPSPAFHLTSLGLASLEAECVPAQLQLGSQHV